MKNIFIVVRDVTGLETASDVSEVNDTQLENLEGLFADVGKLTNFTMTVGGKDKNFNVANIVSIHWEEV